MFTFVFTVVFYSVLSSVIGCLKSCWVLHFYEYMHFMHELRLLLKRTVRIMDELKKLYSDCLKNDLRFEPRNCADLQLMPQLLVIVAEKFG